MKAALTVVLLIAWFTAVIGMTVAIHNAAIYFGATQ